MSFYAREPWTYFKIKKNNTFLMQFLHSNSAFNAFPHKYFRMIEEGRIIICSLLLQSHFS